MTPDATQPELDVLQRWMQSVISHPFGVDAGVESDAAQQEIPIAAKQLDTILHRSRQQTSEERLAVYSNAYRARLLDVMIGEFPALVHAIGEPVFLELAAAYLLDHPPTSYTLAALGQKFPEHLAQTRPEKNANEEASDCADFLIDLARLERHYSEVFDGPGLENLPFIQPEVLQALSPEEWIATRLVPAPCLRLATFRFPVHEYASAVRRNLEPTPPEVRTTFLAITRRDYIVRRAGLDETEYRILAEIVSGKSIGDAIEVALRSHDGPVDALAGQISTWFRNWSAAGYFVGIAE